MSERDPDAPREPGDSAEHDLSDRNLSNREVAAVSDMMRRTTRFSREAVATMISLASAAFGVVAALAWNAAITTTFTRYFGADSAKKIGALFAYAVVVTVVGVTVIVLLGRLAARINAQPVEFKYPVPPRT